jgi:nitrite reductase/ring-hydroxylating ferredoxin subunit
LGLSGRLRRALDGFMGARAPRAALTPPLAWRWMPTSRTRRARRTQTEMIREKEREEAERTSQRRTFATINRCPHMGFPLDLGSDDDGILTCHWHHARLDLESGCTFDLWADDASICPVKVRNGEVWVKITFGHAKTSTSISWRKAMTSPSGPR